MNTKIFLIFIALLCTMLITPAEAMLMIPEEAKTWYVDDSGGADFTNIRAAVNSASSGDTIFVYAGTYDGFEIPVPYLTIKGEGPDLVTVYGRIDIPMTAYYANATGTILEGMKITRAPLISSPCSDTTIRNCVFDGLSSIDLRAERITFENNVISNITGNNALCLRGAHNSIVKNNIIKNCTGSAIWLRGANITVKNNHIESNGYGFYFRDAGNENKIYLNTITGNTQLTKIKGTIPDITYWNSTTPIKYTYNGQTYTGYMGNYYSDYTGTDEDGNGIGDTPYVLPDNLGTDYYPLMQPYENYFNEKPVFTSIEVTPAAADLTTSSTRQFTAKALDQYGNPIENITFTWSSSNEAAGTVNSTGFFTAASVGETTITASAENINGTAKVTVNPPAVAAIKVSPSTASLTPGAALQFTAEAFDQDENPMSGIGFTWSNDNENIGTIDPDGLFTAKSFGTASISAANGEINGTALINATSTDLLAEAIDEGTQVQGKQGTVNITVKNAGPAATGPFSVLLLDGSTEIGRSTIDALGIGESSSVTIPWTPSSYGEANLTAVIDPEGAVADSNPSNNQFSRTVTVTPSLPDLSVSSVSFSNYPFFNNTLEVTIDNSGAKSAGAFNVTILIGEINRNVSIPELGGGNITTFTVKDIKRQVNENVLITVTVDPENSIPEADETNNEYSKSVTITATDQRYMGGRFSSGMDKVNNAVYHEGHIGVAYSLGGTYYTWFTQKGTVTYTTEDLPIPAGATIKSARLYQGCTWYGYPGFTVEFNGHESQERVAQYGDNINGQDAFDVTPYFNATGNNTAVITAGRYQRGFYGTLLIVVYEAESEPYRQIWINEGSDCLLYGSLDPYVGYSMFNNVSTTDIVSARVTTFLESGDNNEQNTIFFNNQDVTITGKGGSDPAFFKYDVTGAIQNGTNELGVRGEGGNYFNFANAILEVTKVTASEANFSANPTSGDAPLAVKFTDTSTGTPASWEWDFGDGSTSTEQNPTHTYTAEGTYTVKLTVSNSLGSDSEEKVGYINVGSAVLAPVADFSSDITGGNAPLAVQFKDESANTPTSWEWDFGDGKTSNEQDPAHTYETVGTYTVKLTASNYGGSDAIVKTDYISVSSDVSAPVASFTTDSNAGNIPFTVKFTDTSTGEISSWKWDFGDGSTSTDQNPTHTYVTEGSYIVTLTATGPGGSDTVTSAEPLLVSAAITSPSYNGGIPLTTVQS
ncbi:MAG: PKD domain-containing protein, partial [Euryarchaeota archaeon]|nr:PKD domain-containing protein [Euryarchaeota archaeon]